MRLLRGPSGGFLEGRDGNLLMKKKILARKNLALVTFNCSELADLKKKRFGGHGRTTEKCGVT